MDQRIDSYIGKAAPFAQPILAHLRKLVHAGCPEATESIKWGHASFGYRGRILAFMAAFKGHVALGFWHKEMKKVVAGNGRQVEGARGVLGRITCLGDLPADRIVVSFVRTAVKLHDAGGAIRPKPRPKPALRTPGDLAAGLKVDPKAAATWEKFSPSHRREYIEWVTEAKRVETRAKRLATTLAWLSAGKARNWQYAKC